MPIKYEYGWLGEQIIHIDSVSPANRQDEYICIGCGNPLTPALGNIRQHHFRHKAVTNCSPETYLHRLAKEKFYETYKHCLENGIPFLINFSVVWMCNHFDWIPEALRCKKPHLETYDLTKYFPTIDLETGHGEFIPDILLRNPKGEVLYVEIKVSHGCTLEKVNSGNRIIEIDIDWEEDIENLAELNLTESPRVKFFNFIRQERTGDHCGGKCDLRHSACLSTDDFYVAIDKTPPKSQKPTVAIDETPPISQQPTCLCRLLLPDRLAGRVHIVNGRKVVAPSHYDALVKFNKMPRYYNALPKLSEMAALRSEDYLQDPEEETAR